MEHQTTAQHQTKIIQLQASKKRPLTLPLHIIATLLIFIFFIRLSIISNYLFLKEILIVTTIIGLVLGLKETERSNQ